MIRNFFVGAVLSAVSFTSYADHRFVGVDYIVKQKQNVPVKDTHLVQRITVGEKFDKWTFAIRAEAEAGKESGKAESLMQLQTTYDLPRTFGIKPYLYGAVGQKYQNTENFGFYSVGAGAWYSLTDRVSLNAASWIRSPFSQTSMGDGPNRYRTVENSAGISYALTKTLATTFRVKHESGDSDYHTYDVGIVYKF